MKNAQKEAEFQQEVIGLAESMGILALHIPANVRMRGWRGWPDLTLIGTHGIMFRELKTYENRVAGRQAFMKNRMLGAGADWGLWTIPDLESGRIERELRSLVEETEEDRKDLLRKFHRALAAAA